MSPGAVWWEPEAVLKTSPPSLSPRPISPPHPWAPGAPSRLLGKLRGSASPGSPRTRSLERTAWTVQREDARKDGFPELFILERDVRPTRETTVKSSLCPRSSPPFPPHQLTPKPPVFGDQQKPLLQPRSSPVSSAALCCGALVVPRLPTQHPTQGPAVAVLQRVPSCAPAAPTAGQPGRHMSLF